MAGAQTYPNTPQLIVVILKNEMYFFSLPNHQTSFRQTMFLIQVLRLFIQQDKKLSLQRSLLQKKTVAAENDYSRLIHLTEKHKFKKALTFSERLFLARYFKSFQNERNGKTLRYMSNGGNPE